MEIERVGVVLAGGMGTRFGGEEPKQLARLAGHSVLYHSLRRLERSGLLDSIIVVANASWKQRIEQEVGDAVRSLPSVVVPGGGTRNASLRSALTAIESSEAKVLIHDSVRPLVSPELIGRVITALDESRCVLPVVPSADLLVDVRSSGEATFLDRRNVLRGQSPQGFYLSDLRETFILSKDDKNLDYPTVFEAVIAACDLQVATVDGEHSNIKVTVPVDHMIAGRLLLED